MKLRPVAVALVATVALAGACGDGASGAAPVPDSHPAVDLADRSGGADEFAERASQRDLAFACGQGGLAPRWQVCMLRADGVVALVGFGDTTRIDVRFTGPSHDGVLVPLDRSVVYGVREPSGNVRLVIESAGRAIGEIAAEL